MDRANPQSHESDNTAAHGRPLGVYVHFPWCLSKCPYCDFFSIATSASAIAHDAYAEAVITEFEQRIAKLAPASLASIYLGGGTPSLWHPRALEAVITRICGGFDTKPTDVEITLECNPSSFELALCGEWQAMGVGRLSLGLQSLNDHDLGFLGRLHDAQQGLTALHEALRSGMDRVCVDLIFGLPNRSPQDALYEIQRLPLEKLSHLSVYALTIESNTVFGAKARQGRLPLAEEELVADTFFAIHDRLTSCGFVHYETSNYARSGHESLHNSSYWKGHDYLGLGAAAWGTVQLQLDEASEYKPHSRVRYRNTTRIEHYMNLMAGKSAPHLWQKSPSGMLAECELIDNQTALTERLMLGLRTQAGVDLAELSRELDEYSWRLRKQSTIERLIQQGRLTQVGSKLVVPIDKWFVADGIIASLI